MSLLQPGVLPASSRREAADEGEAIVEMLDTPGPDAYWRVHDRTHLELDVPYRLADVGEHRMGWEAYFFIPQSFRIDKTTYPKTDVYNDLISYLRLMAPPGSLDAIATELDESFDCSDPDKLRVLACRIRRRGFEEQHALMAQIAEDPDGAEPGLTRFVVSARHLASRVHALTIPPSSETDAAATALRWIDEDVSILLETVAGKLALCLPKSHATTKQKLVELALEEARYRRRAGYHDSVVDSSQTRTIEKLEFRRHTLKRFTAGVLWLDARISEPGGWAKHALYALAASVAMAFAVGVALYNGPLPGENQLSAWLVVAIFAYAVKDRVKAGLQEVFSGVLSKRFPDRRWELRASDGQKAVAEVDERSGFADFDDVPAAALEVRRQTRRHEIEEEARPETVFWHRKEVRVDRAALDGVETGVDGLLEIFRLDLRRWLTHTDDAKNRIVLAQEDGSVKELSAPRVYNIGVVYRLLRPSDPNPPWRRIRVVVYRKGIKRIEHID